MGRRIVVDEDCTYDVVSELEVPEGGWGWIAACGLALMFTVTLAPFSVFGLLYDDFLQSLGEGTQTITLISNLTVCFSCLFGVVINYLLTKYSCRQVGVAGSVVFFIGSLTSTFANSTVLLAFAYGALQGIGLGLMVPAALTSFNHYFFRRRTFAMGVTQVITGIGCMILPIILQKLMEIYGFRGTQMIISAISLHSLLCAAVQTPAALHMRRKKVDLGNLQEYVSENDGNNGKDSIDSETTVVNRKPQTLKEFQNHVWESSDLRTTAMKGKTETLEQSQSSETLGGMHHDSFHRRDENISRENVKGEILTGDSNAEIDHVTNINVKLHSQKDFQTVGNISQNPSLLREGQAENTNGNFSIRTLDEVVAINSDRNKESQNIVVDHEVNHTKYEKCDVQEDDSADQNLLRGDYLKVHCFQNRPSTDLSSTTTGNPISISDSRATVSSLRSWTSSCERRRRMTKDETLMSKTVNNTRKPNIFSRSWCAVINFLDLRLLLDPVYVNIVFGTGISFFADITYCALFPLVILRLGYSRADSAICISILAAADIFGRLSVALIGAFYPHITNRALFFAGSVTSVIGRIMFVSYEDFIPMAILIGYLGFTRSFIHVPMSLVLAEYSVKKFPAAYGLSMVVSGIIGLSAGPFVGWVRDTTNSFPICINTLNALQVAFCVAPWALEYVVCHLRAPSRTKQNSSL